MLTKETKDRIDRARQILVGQLPLPSDQIELITIALIYKFMDDMDEQSRNLGGQASFFVGKLRDYGWREIIANKLDAKERVDRFVKGIELLSDPKENPVPDLFQSIFRNTFLKFRDGRTLKLFLDEINGFTYDHSEELGNAFEYLLDTMGTQADNGQFRTPRHVIDFVVAAVDPKLAQTILDPACGTAGFLISAFRHIIAAHTSEPQEGRARRPGDQLTAEQRQQLTRDIVGYDITPQMARLSRVNMYLHQFASPVIHEYDTITNTARWDEKFDVILANPPFMSPHGGNQTHDKFRIAASRTEVLFADYILEHLLPDGRAGFIVPEGIIFQNNGDYVALRKWLIEEGGLWAVASLPAGVFQPYSGVKTSILFIDRALARRRNDVLLLKIENDGFGLNTNRNPIAENDLPAALMLIEAARGEQYQGALAKLSSPVQYSLVSRADLAQLDAYRSNAAAWDLCRKRYVRLGKAETDLSTLRADARADPRAVTRAERAMARLRGEFPAETGLPSVPANATELKREFEHRIKSAAIAYGNDPKAPTTLTSEMREYLDGHREYNLSFDRGSDVQIVQTTGAANRIAIGELATMCGGGTPSKANPAFWGGDIPWVSPKDMKSMVIVDTEDHVSKEAIEASSTKLVPENTVICVVRSGILQHTFPVAITARPVCLNQDLLAIMTNISRLDPRFLLFVLKGRSAEILRDGIKSGVTVQSFHNGFFKSLEIPVPPLGEQRAIVAELEGFQRVVDGCAALLVGYRPDFPIDAGWPSVVLGEIIEGKPKNGYSGSPVGYMTKLKVLTLTATSSGKLDISQHKFLDEDIPTHAQCRCRRGDIYLQRGNTKELVGTAAIFDLDEPDFIYPDLMIRVRADETKVLSHYLLYALQSTRVRDYLTRNAVGSAGNMPKINQGIVERIPISLPSIETQRAIVAELMREQATLAGVAELKAKYEALIRARLDRVWGELATPAISLTETPALADAAA